MRVSSRRNRIPRIHCQPRRCQDRPCQNTSHLGMDDPKIKKGNSMLPRILQLLSKVHRRVQQNSKTTLREDRKETRPQLGIGGQRTTRIRRTKNETHHPTRTRPFRPHGTTQNRNRRLEICLLWNCITTIRGRQMETRRHSVKNNKRCRMQLQCSR